MYSHSELVQYAKAWLERKRYVVLHEIGCSGNEKPDAIGFKSGESALVECKASRSDFLADKSKMFRLHPEFGMGMFRYYMCPHGLIAVDDLPDRWGLLWIKSGRVFLKKRSASFFYPETIRSEHRLLFSVVRRISAAGCLDLSVSMESKRQHLIKEQILIEGEIRKLKQRYWAAKDRLAALEEPCPK